MLSRRQLLMGALAAADSPWLEMDRILKRVQPPEFPKKDVAVTAYGAKADGVTDSTEAFWKAVRECNAAGGGRVIVAGGVFLTGPIHLMNNVNLHVAAGATIRFHRDPKRYLPLMLTRWEGVECMNYSPLIYALDRENIGITGEGTLDGNADRTAWWPWKGRTEYGWKKGDPNQLAARDMLVKMGETDVPAAQRQFGEGAYLRPQFIEPYRCKNVLIQGVTIINSPMWEIHPVLSQNVMIDGVKIDTHGPNNDGCDPESCRDVVIQNCTFNTGDDCIAIKSGRNREGRRIGIPSENIVIRNCLMKDGHGAVTLGSELSGGIRNVFVEKCRMESPNQERILRIKTNSVRGGYAERIYMRDMKATEVADSIVSIDFTYEEGDSGKFDPVVKDIWVSNVTCTKAKYAIYMKGFARKPISNVVIEDCVFDGVKNANVLEHVNGLVLRNVKINGKTV